MSIFPARLPGHRSHHLRRLNVPEHPETFWQVKFLVFEKGRQNHLIGCQPPGGFLHTEAAVPAARGANRALSSAPLDFKRDLHYFLMRGHEGQTGLYMNGKESA